MNRSLSGLITDAKIFLSEHFHEVELSLHGIRVLMKCLMDIIMELNLHLQAIKGRLNEMATQPKDP